ncbi:helix-turn-helix domain-containing protein [Nitriliruptoraceae bacterium ZYF776]|nr:helix-turn-helix domain-containing protein [Profundirhabdus halotolerans]
MKQPGTPTRPREAGRTDAATTLPDDQDELPMVLRVSEVAELLRVDPDTVYSMVRRGELPVIRVGRVFRFSRDQLIQFVKGSYP